MKFTMCSLLKLCVLVLALLVAVTLGEDDSDRVVEEARGVKRNLTEKMEELAEYLRDSVQLVRGIEARFMQTYRRQPGLKTNNTTHHPHDVTAGAVFTRWGNDTCTEETEMAYHGFTVSGHYSQTGGGSNMLCAHAEPQFDRTFSSNTSQHGYLYGAEYEMLWRSDMNNQDAPCAVCRSPTRSSSIMVPGQHECMKGWHTEYWGFLVGSKHTDPSNSEYICLDSNPDTIEGGYASTDGRTLYNVRVQCGALPCPPYRSGYFVPCVLCTR